MEAARSLSRPCITYNGGEKVIACSQCGCYLSNENEIISTRFQGSTGKASLYLRVWNIRCSEKQTREMMTGKHIVRDVECMVCGLKLGWMYEYAHCDEQRYKEQRVILEQKLVTSQDGVCDPEYGYNGPYPTTMPDNSDTPVEVVPDEPIATQRIITFKTKR